MRLFKRKVRDKLTTQNNAKPSRGMKISFWIYILLSLVAIFYLPNFIPVDAVASDSYVFGYNNHAGFLLFIFLTAIGAFWSQKFCLTISSTDPTDRVQRKTFWICLAGALAACIAMYFLTSRMGRFGEATYLINRIELASQGLRPYRDFEFAYGALFVYLPLLLGRLLGMTIPNAYYLFWALNVLAGVWALSEIINRIDPFSQRKNHIFILLYLSIFPGIMFTGLNYTGFRFLIAPLLGLIVYRAIQNATARGQIIGSLLVVCFTALLILISPEMGIGFSVGISAFYFLFYVRAESKLWVIPYLAMLLLLTILMFAANRLQVFYTLKQMGHGGYNFPIIPAAHILLLFVSVFLAAAYFVAKICHGGFQSSTILVLLISLPPLAACMGRCDPGHVIFDGIGIFLVVLLYTSTHPRIWRWYRMSFVVVFILFYLSSFFLYREEIGRALIMCAIRDKATFGSSVEKVADSIERRVIIGRYGETVGNEKLRRLRYALAIDARSDSVQVPPQLRGVANVPFGYSVTHNPTGTDGGYYYGLVDVFDQGAVTSKISELERHPSRELILPTSYDDSCHLDPDASSTVTA
jgi:hypothetical protein